MRLSEVFQWEVEGPGGIVRQYNDNGSENPSTLIPEDVVRISIIPFAGGVLRHDVIINKDKGERFVKRFGRGIIKNRGGGYGLVEYLHCIQTNNYRFWVFSTTGQSLVTAPDFEVYL